MSVHIRVDQLFRRFDSGDLYQVSESLGVLGLRPVVRSSGAYAPNFIACSLCSLLDEIEAGVWEPLNERNTFPGREPITLDDAIRQDFLALRILLEHRILLDEKEVPSV